MRLTILGILILTACSPVFETEPPEANADCQYSQDVFENLKKGLATSIDNADMSSATWYVNEASECRTVGLITLDQQNFLDYNFRNAFKS